MQPSQRNYRLFESRCPKPAKTPPCLTHHPVPAGAPTPTATARTPARTNPVRRRGAGRGCRGGTPPVTRRPRFVDAYVCNAGSLVSTALGAYPVRLVALERTAHLPPPRWSPAPPPPASPPPASLGPPPQPTSGAGGACEPTSPRGRRDLAMTSAGVSDAARQAAAVAVRVAEAAGSDGDGNHGGGGEGGGGDSGGVATALGRGWWWGRGRNA